MRAGVTQVIARPIFPIYPRRPEPVTRVTGTAHPDRRRLWVGPRSRVQPAEFNADVGAALRPVADRPTLLAGIAPARLCAMRPAGVAPLQGLSAGYPRVPVPLSTMFQELLYRCTTRYVAHADVTLKLAQTSAETSSAELGSAPMTSGPSSGRSRRC